MNRTTSRRWRWLRWLVWAILLLVALAATVAVPILSLPQFGGKVEGDRLLRARNNPQFRDGRFVNEVPQASYRPADVWALITGQFFGNEVRVPTGAIPVRAIAPDSLKAATPAPGLRAFWIGHASVYVEIDGLRMLVDPIFSEYASPFDLGPRRFHPPPLPLEGLPKIDAVLITHDHYDHLDMRTIRHLARRGATFFVPLGIGAHLQAWGVADAQVHELEWWQEQSVRGVRIVSTPSRHYSGRGLTDASATLWTSWSVIGARHRFHVSGDTGYSDHFRRIGDRFGPFDLAFIKIGAYGPGAPWRDIHMGPEDAVRAHLDLRARLLFPVHWATFNLAFHDWDEPIRRALAAARAQRVEMLAPKIGETVEVGQATVIDPWWEAVRGNAVR